MHLANIMNKIICADSQEFMQEMPEEIVQLTVTSPPYDNLRTYKGYSFDEDEMIKGLYRVTKPGGVVVWIVADATIKGSKSGSSWRQAEKFRKAGFKIHDVMIWHKNKLPVNAKRYEPSWEYMFIFLKGKIKIFNPIMVKKLYKDKRKNKTAHRTKNGSRPKTCSSRPDLDFKVKENLWYYPVGGGHMTKDKIAYKHPAIFPENIARDHIITWSNKFDLVFDPMNGAGTTTKMAKFLHRRYIGIDCSEEYCNIAKKRLEGAFKYKPDKHIYYRDNDGKIKYL